MSPIESDDPKTTLPTIRVQSTDLDALRTPLSVILVSAQLLEHRLLRGDRLIPDELLARTGAIERAVWQIEGVLRTLQQKVET